MHPSLHSNTKQGKNNISPNSLRMPFKTRDLQLAAESLREFRRYSVSPHHERFSFPLLRGTYFTYRKIDVLR
ncbi:MAG: hypothetical protein WCF23_10380, partial [Candidatus Nitrosopolaris sp.]